MPSKLRLGAGDRWLAGEIIPGVALALHDEVEIVGGRYTGRRGRVLLLVALPPEPAYLVALTGDDAEAAERPVRARQSSLRLAR